MCPSVAEICGRQVVSGVNGGGRDEKNCTVVGLGVFARGRRFGMGAGGKAGDIPQYRSLANIYKAVFSYVCYG